MNPGRSVRSLAIGCALAALACTDPVDKAARERIFSPEDPPKAVASAKESLPAAELEGKPEAVRRVLGVGASEATERLGPHTLTSTVRFQWSSPRNVALEETRTFVAGGRGVSGDFHATIENSRNQGLEVLRVRGDVYARSRFGKYRHRKRDRGAAERARDEVYASLADFDRLFRWRLALKQVGQGTHEGREVWKYAVGLASSPQGAPAAPSLPPPQYAKGGPDPDTARRLRFATESEPQSAEGEIWVDAATSVVVKARVQGRLATPGEDGGTSTLALSLDSAVTGIGRDPKLQKPEEFLPDADKPQGIADALDQFGIPRGAAADAGVPPAARRPGAEEEEPSDDDEG